MQQRITWMSPLELATTRMVSDGCHLIILGYCCRERERDSEWKPRTQTDSNDTSVHIRAENAVAASWSKQRLLYKKKNSVANISGYQHISTFCTDFIFRCDCIHCDLIRILTASFGSFCFSPPPVHQRLQFTINFWLSVQDH